MKEKEKSVHKNFTHFLYQGKRERKRMYTKSSATYIIMTTSVRDSFMFHSFITNSYEEVYMSLFPPTHSSEEGIEGRESHELQHKSSFQARRTLSRSSVNNLLTFKRFGGCLIFSHRE